nr:four helix bundle suffix domain-containing protein [Chlorobium ferrooxidans]
MVQAARSGVQNIAEGSQASGTSKKTELKLTGVARASLEELRLDFEDYLRQRQLKIWDRTDPIRQSLIDRRCTSADDVALWVKNELIKSDDNRSDFSNTNASELAANAVLVLIAVACTLLDRQIRSLAKSFETEGGISERLYNIRAHHRRQK